MAENTVRSGTDRRQFNNEDCTSHLILTDKLQSSVDKNSGRWTAMLWFLGVIGTVLLGGMATLITKTSDIQTLLSKNDVVLMQHSERIDGLRKDMDAVKSRNEYIDRQSASKVSVEK